ncbi:MAG: exodeoxyribonuclease VII large subunit [Clostridia bacterium]|nr:exodeoxyribonuclease VII large subunit [Clostridia bacterium]
MNTSRALTVSQLNMYVKMKFESDERLNKVLLIGEISNFVNHYKTGHCYFSLKDSESAVKAVMFSRNAQQLKFTPENGMRVYATGRVSVFERDGVYQLYVDTMEPEGAGALMLAFEQLKNKLTAEGIFDDEIKKPIPQFPQKIAVVTSPVGAAVQDVINVLSRRYPLAELILCPVAAQGVNCASENMAMLNHINAKKSADIIILCRGGGSIEDLWSYNDEQLVRTVASSSIPIITGIGHETDFTLCDFAADLRAPTPSAAAELAVPDIEELYQINDGLIYRTDNAIEKYLDERESHLLNLNLRLAVLDPKKKLEKQIDELNTLNLRLNSVIKFIIDEKSSQLKVASEKLKLLNPYELLKKGYIPVYSNGKRVASVTAVAVGDELSLTFADGKAHCNVTQIITEE